VADQKRGNLLLYGGLGLLGFAGVMLLGQSSTPVKPPPGPPPPGGKPPPPGPPPPTSTHCYKNTHQSPDCRLVRPSRFYNWSDLRVLPLRASDRPSWYTGGTTLQLGMLLGAQLWYTEAKFGTAGDGSRGWFLRIANPGMRPGDWALPAADCGVSVPCS
jgi:hypothetical protein